MDHGIVERDGIGEAGAPEGVFAVAWSIDRVDTHIRIYNVRDTTQHL